MDTPLRIGIIGPCPPPHGGVTRVLSNHVAEWRALPVQAWLLPIEVPDEPQIYPGVSFVDHRTSAKRWHAAPGAFARLAPRLGPMRPSQYGSMLSLDLAVHDAIRRHRLDVIYAHHSTLTGAIAVTEARRAGIPSLVVAYGETWLVSPQDQRRRRLIEYTVRHADWIVSTSEHCQRGAIRRGAEPARTSVIYAGIDLARFRPGLDGREFRAKHGIPGAAVIVSVLGLALRNKLDTFLNAIGPLLEDPNLHVLIGGTGEDAKYLVERITGISSGRVKALGFVPEPDLPSFYAATDVLVVAQRTLVECMGQSMKEAMSCARPVVGSNIGGVPEAIEDGRSGLLFEPDNPADLVRALRELISDADRRRRLGARAREIAEKKFDAAVAARQTYDALRGLARRRVT